MKLLDKYEFTNGKAFETYLLERQDTARYNVAECDVIGLRRVGDDNDLMTVMRPDEALIASRMLIDAVQKMTEGYEIKLYESHAGDRKEVFRASSQPLAMDLVDDLGRSGPCR